MYQKNIHYSHDLEMAILGVCMLENTAFGRTYGLIDEKTFYATGHAEVYKALRHMYESAIPIDLLTVCDYLIRGKGMLEIQATNTAYFVTRLTNSVVSSAHLEYHCYVIKSMWIQRQLIELTHSGLSDETDTRKQILELQSKLHELSSGATGNEWKDMSEVVIELLKHQDQMQKTQGKGITTGIQELNEDTGGFHPGNVVVIAARPSVGKSALMGQIAMSMAKEGRRVGIISLEMTNIEMAARMVSIDCDVDFSIIYRGMFTDENQKERMYAKINNSTSQLPIFISDKTNVNIHEIRSKAMKLKHRHGLDVLFIDYLQLVEGDGDSFKNRENEISRIGRGAKILAKELNIVVVELCQMNREVTKRTGSHRYPVLSDLRESGSIEQDCDIAIFLHRDFMSGIPENEDGSSTENEADLIVRKWRNGPTNFIIPMRFEPTKMMFKERSKALVSSWKTVRPQNIKTSSLQDPNKFIEPDSKTGNNDEEAPF